MVGVNRNHVDSYRLIAGCDVLRPVFVVASVLALCFQVEDYGGRVFLTDEGLEFAFGVVHLLYPFPFDCRRHVLIPFDPVLD